MSHYNTGLDAVSIWQKGITRGEELDTPRINCIHLSDIHMNNEKARIDLVTVLDHLWDDIAARTDINPNLEKIDLVFISGDVAYHGRAEEYEMAEELLLKPLYDKVGKYSDLSIYRTGKRSRCNPIWISRGLHAPSFFFFQFHTERLFIHSTND